MEHHPLAVQRPLPAHHPTHREPLHPQPPRQRRDGPAPRPGGLSTQRPQAAMLRLRAGRRGDRVEDHPPRIPIGELHPAHLTARHRLRALRIRQPPPTASRLVQRGRPPLRQPLRREPRRPPQPQPIPQRGPGRHQRIRLQPLVQPVRRLPGDALVRERHPHRRVPHHGLALVVAAHAVPGLHQPKPLTDVSWRPRDQKGRPPRSQTKRQRTHAPALSEPAGEPHEVASIPVAVEERRRA